MEFRAPENPIARHAKCDSPLLTTPHLKGLCPLCDQTRIAEIQLARITGKGDEK
jgi:hypothetical protein